jgi:hypothetical protein
MAYNQPQHGGAADGYYQQDGQQDAGMQQQPYGGQPQQPHQNGQYQQQGQQQYPPPQEQQYPQAPPPKFTEQQPQANGGGEKNGFDQTFKLDQPKYNDLWAALLFLATFAGFTAVSGLTIYAYSHTKGQQGSGIYNGSGVTRIALNTNTIILL